MMVHHFLFAKFTAKTQVEEAVNHSCRFQIEENIARNWVEEVGIKL